jgi:outer membrane protein OmpA-like peptidoglycan-associated protein
MKRADQVMAMMKQELSTLGIRNVKFTSNAVGEDEPLFSNDTPEGRMYNRTVVIDIIP